MVLVDTSVWIDFFAGRDLPHVSTMERLIAQNDDLALCGIILTEILQGIAEDTTYRRVRRGLRPLLMLSMQESVFVDAADMYRSLRGKGIQIRSSKEKPAQAIVAVRHREYWFYIDDKDLKSKMTFTFLMILFSVTETGGKEGLPLVTIPAG